ncbi:phage tail tip lysozyme [Nocardiopsis sp. NPDC058789]|uniref:phage tail tip lysozyme n=1 Tax=Nocardiopsis sp. NPDC058789 TaxID=3346634 RepID=UPI00366A5F9A
MAGARKGAGVAAAVPAVGVGAQLMVLMMFLKWLKQMLAAVLAALLNLLQMLLQFFIMLAKFALGFALVMGGLFAFLGGGVIAGAIIGIGAAFVAIATVAVVAVGAATSGTTAAQHEAPLDDCRAETEAVVREIDDNADAGEDSQQKEEVAQQVYSVLSVSGMPDENIAGILGNFEKESRMDPTMVELVGGKGFTIDDVKRNAEEKGFKFSELENGEYDHIQHGVDLLGIGLGQWSNGRNTNLLEYADGTGGKWHEIETQMSFLISGDASTYTNVVQELIDDDSPSVGGATRTWLEKWEIPATIDAAELAQREGYADVWFAKMDGWEADEDLADSILEQAEVTVVQANQNRRETAIQECRTASTGGGSVVQAGETVPCDSLGRMHPDACDMHKALQDEFGGFFLTAGGQRNEPSSNHHNGQAIDYMMAPLNEVPSDKMRESGTTVVNFVIANAEEFNISGILWNERKWAAGNDPVGEWNDENTRYAGGRGSNTQNHVDHVHISVGPDPFK